MSEKDSLRFLTVILNISAIVCIALVWNLSSVLGNHLPSVYVASKERFSTVCIDSSGISRNHLDEWTDAVNSCDRRICFSQAADIFAFEVRYDCPTPEDIYDAANCAYVAGSALTFPTCCPEIQCSYGTAVNNTLPACSDRSSAANCNIWKSKTNCQDHADPDLSRLYNITLTYCRATCGYCTPIG